MIKEILCPPGNGIYTVHTGAKRKKNLHQMLYQSSDPTDVHKSWSNSFENAFKNFDDFFLLGIPSDCGGGILRGANWGPLFIREFLLEQHPHLKYNDLGDIRTIPHLLHDKYLNQETIEKCRQALYQDKDSPHSVSPLSMTEELLNHLYKTYPDIKILGLGGDHSVSYPLVKEYIHAKKQQNIRCAIIHFDAHTDLLNDRLGIDLCFGTWAAQILNHLESPKQLIQIGLRSSNKTKEYWESTLGTQQFWANEIKQEGPLKISQNIISSLKEQNIEEIYISFDIDALDEKYAMATGTSESHGPGPAECAQIIQSLKSEFKISGCDLVEVAPHLGKGGHLNPEPDSTLLCACGLIAQMIEGEL
jgi:agmatinase